MAMFRECKAMGMKRGVGATGKALTGTLAGRDDDSVLGRHFSSKGII